MTLQEFETFKFRFGMKLIYKEKEYDIIGVDFEEALVCINETENSDGDWKRVENIKIA